MKTKFFWEGFLSAFDPFKMPPRRKAPTTVLEQDVLEGEYRRVPEAEMLMHNAFAKALADVK